MRKYYILLAFLIVVSGVIYSQTSSITNIQVSQQTDNSGLVDVYFDLSGTDGSYYLSMSVSFDGGSTFTPIESTFLSEDIGPINPGTNKHIIWDGGQSFPDTYSMQSQLKIIAYISDCEGSLVDGRDGKTYSTVQIGSQCWMAENLNYETINSWWYNNSWYNGYVYGRLYTWEAALTACPSGWHLPSDEEWTILSDFLGDASIVGGKMKSTSGWYRNGNGTNSSGFNARPGGYYSNGSFYWLGRICYLWSSSEYSGSLAWGKGVNYSNDNVVRIRDYKTTGLGVRCLKN